MSAYVVNKRHIDALVTGALGSNGRFDWNVEDAGEQFGWRQMRLDWTNADEVGAMLWNENVRSVRFRYPNDAGDELPGPYGFTPGDADAYTLAPLAEPLTPEELMLAIHGFEYQSCEHEGWRKSDAFAFCRALEREAMRRLPGYEAADTWGIDDDRPTRSIYQGVARR